MKIGIASPPFPKSISDGLYWLEKLVKNAAEKQAEIVCFPESYIPGYPLEELTIETSSPEKMQHALEKACTIAADNNIAIILPMDWYTPRGFFNIAHVISNTGEVLGYQTKNQLDPTEDNIWIPGTERSIFEINGVKFGITICHEGFRYPESVRWAARHGATIVFHPHCNCSNVNGAKLVEYRNRNSPYYEQAIMMRALENTIYFASANYSSHFPESVSSIIAPDGTCLVHETYGKTGVIMAEIDPMQATGLLAKRFKPELYT
ncbi:carbon-nitrogen hydrolase family protein [Mucilaginibacter sp. UR6-11]|uniref:carbon-nitrogen hydrolase family protein n=1 Tax=Mucilaginibacter sp. UR6-11 TaxID=1435644 RepID=UPI001E4E3D3F|nr:carbon-nitrogen hydrolase family protein [Mucilaginibacter sp. UR6-11]MCC8426533.1 carbon-nitrogen hydrolase family protein [Mucilaginibacter sp. UR6-11]